MTYMGLPRLHFAGTFTTKPSTINNIPDNYRVAPSPPRPVWNPNGNALWLLDSCRITSVVDAQGTHHRDGGGDPLVGQSLSATDDWGGSGVPAKIVDIDPQQQMVSMIYGLQLEVGGGTDGVTGDFRPMWFQNLWGQGTGRPAGAIYQSVLESLSWGGSLTSPVLRQLQAASPDLLSIRFTLDLPTFVPDDDNPSSPMTVCKGRFVGTIGPAEAGAPDSFVVGRLLRPASASSPSNFAPALVDKAQRRLTVDLGNSIPWSSAGGDQPDLGNLQVALGGEQEPAILLGSVDYSPAAYGATALVQDFTLSDRALEVIDIRPLSVVQVSGGAEPMVVGSLLKENDDGIYIDASPYVFRIEPGHEAEVELVATRFGLPIADFEIALQDATGRLQQPPPPVAPPVGVPESALSFPTSVKTGANGRATAALSAKDPGNPRGFIDGQVYAVAFKSPADSAPDPNSFLSILVHGAFDKAPTWENLKPIMAQYARLYPYMNQNFFQLDDPEALQRHAQSLITVFSYPIEDPRYMPVVRDLSSTKKEALIAWLRAGAPTV